MKKDYRGKLKTLYNNSIIQEYIEECGDVLGGYLGHENRTDRIDMLLEKLIELEYIDEDSLAIWICSGDSRYFMDECNSEEYFKDNIMFRIMGF